MGRGRTGTSGFWRWVVRAVRLRGTPGGVQASLERLHARLDESDRLLRRIQRDAERVRLHTALILGADRALALLATGHSIYVDPRDGGCGANLLREGRYEEDELRLFRRFLRSGAQVLDIGANYGIYTIAAVPYLRPGGHVTAFEPNPHVHRLLRSSVHLNGFFDAVETQCAGASDAAGTLRFQIDDSSPGGAHILSGERPVYPDMRLIDVEVVTIDQRLGPNAVIDLVKIDVEGHEEQVLRGMRGVIARSPGITIFMELFYPLFANDDDFVRLLRLITDELGLTVNRIAGDGRVISADVETLRGRTCNLILTKGPFPDLPDLAIAPAQLACGAETRLEDDALVWRSAEAAAQLVSHGPYLFLPAGRYRLVIEGEFAGAFVCRIQEHHGDIVWSTTIGPGTGHIAEVTLAFDAPHMEVCFWSLGGAPAAMTLHGITFWPA